MGKTKGFNYDKATNTLKVSWNGKKVPKYGTDTSLAVEIAYNTDYPFTYKDFNRSGWTSPNSKDLMTRANIVLVNSKTGEETPANQKQINQMLDGNAWFTRPNKFDFNKVYYQNNSEYKAQSDKAVDNVREGLKTMGKSGVDTIGKTGSTIGHIFGAIGSASKNDVVGAGQHIGNAVAQGTKAIKGVVNFMKGAKQFLFNHPEWYGKYPELINSNLTFGVRKEHDKFDMAIGARVGISLIIPQKNGVVSQAFKDATTAIYAKLRGSNSGAFNYDVKDVAAYIECTRTIYALHAQLCRDIKLLNNVDAYIAKTPDPILHVAGYNGASILYMRNNANDIVTQLNQLARAIEVRFPLIPDLSVYLRDRFLASTVLEEGKGPKSSIYVYSLDSALAPVGGNDEVDVENYYVTAGTCDYASNLTKLRNLIDAMDTYVNTTYGGQTFNKIAGDIIRAYGEQCFTQLGTVTVNDKVQVSFDEYSLNQIQNANMVDQWEHVQSTGSNNAFSIDFEISNKTQGITGKVYNLILHPGTIATAGAPMTEMIINRSAKQVSSLEAISLTRLNYTVQLNGATERSDVAYYHHIQDCGTDIASSFVYKYFNNGNVLADYNLVTMTDISMDKELVSFWSQVDYSPVVFIYDSGTTSPDKYPVVDLDTYAFMALAQYHQFNDAAVMSEYKTVPIIDQANFRSAKKRA